MIGSLESPSNSVVKWVDRERQFFGRKLQETGKGRAARQSGTSRRACLWSVAEQLGQA
jgi:hypothetical protein